MASTRPTRWSRTPPGRLEKRRVGAAASSITKTPLSSARRIKRSEGLGDPAAGHGVVIGLAAEAAAPGLVQDIGPGPRNAVEDQKAQGAAGDIDPVAHRVGAQEAGVLLGPEDVDQGSDVQRFDMLGVEGEAPVARGAAICS